ncbi:transcription termination/antitermination protein NusG [Sinorhizobium sp. A49]|uniref:transcription termination/antitermination protein NusG n=1 Tax=Sinorhizobium sp. A49 TaxID=1945861 RepID=UPI000984B6DF|nr:transcription termination/antitermination NusG family protein [Sinorhizobium sp. A49]OOG61962.1 hypothetical protein B0E45_31640 [Sinorhizobium sp. A49]
MSWYAIKTRPGTQRLATPRVGETEDRKGEFIIERNLRNADFEIFLPSTQIVYKHHKTKKTLEKRAAMLVGYAFIYMPRSFYELSQVDGVSAVLGIAGRPMPIAEKIIQAIREAEDECVERIQRAKRMRERQEAVANGNATKKQLREMFPTQSAVRISSDHHLLGGMVAKVLDATGRKTLKTVVETLEGLVSVEIPVEYVEKIA